MPYKYDLLSAQRYLNQMYPGEEHNAGGDCMNPKCDYSFTPDDIDDMHATSGWHVCPKCNQSNNYLDDSVHKPGGWTRSGLTMAEMGTIGEQVVEQMGSIPGVGKVTQTFPYHSPIDAVIGPYGVEIKTIHSEVQARFKIGGAWVLVNGKMVPPREGKIAYCQENGLIPALLGVRLNFYKDIADLWFRQGISDTWIQNKMLQHVATVNFRALNPFKDPSEVPPPDQMPDEDDIPF